MFHHPDWLKRYVFPFLNCDNWFLLNSKWITKWFVSLSIHWPYFILLASACAFLNSVAIHLCLITWLSISRFFGSGSIIPSVIAFRSPVGLCFILSVGQSHFFASIHSRALLRLLKSKGISNVTRMKAVIPSAHTSTRKPLYGWNLKDAT